MKHELAIGRKYGWKPELPTAHKKFFMPKLARATAPVVVDLRSKMPPIYDQGQVGSCVANATAGAYDYQRGAEGLAFMSPSRLFIYANARLAEGTALSNDSGCCISDAVESVSKLGVCPESEWPYIESQFSAMPPTNCYTDALKSLALEKQSVDVGDIPAALAEGRPVICGFTLYPEFESTAVAQSGIVPMPGFFELPIGGHGIVIVGCDTTKEIYICRNSWGGTWGQSGYFIVPMAYAQKFGSDFWTLVKVE